MSMICFCLVYWYSYSYSIVGDLGHIRFLTIMVLSLGIEDHVFKSINFFTGVYGYFWK